MDSDLVAIEFNVCEEPLVAANEPRSSEIGVKFHDPADRPKGHCLQRSYGSAVFLAISVETKPATQQRGLLVSSGDTVSAGILVIGDEILSGRTKDKNIGYIAEYLTNLGIDVAEVRVVPDDEARIVGVLDEMRDAYDYVLTTGGIGPTHDDITADCVAKAFGVGISENDEALKMLASRFPDRDLTEARRRMARIPHGALLVENPVSKAPGFEIGNVFVMAGVPSIMQAMLDNVAKRMRTGVKLHVVNIETRIREGDVAAPLRVVHEDFPDVAIGSYPYYSDKGFGANVVCRGKEPARVEAAGEAVIKALSGLGEVRRASSDAA